MEALILVGGAGTRLRPVIGADLPKPMAPVAGRPFLDWLLAQLRDSGFEQVWLLTGHRGDVIEEHVGRGLRWGLDVRYSRETAPLGTGGALRQVLPRLTDEPCLVLNGDSYLAAPLGDLTAAHAASDAAVTLALARVPDVRRYGSVELAIDGTVSAFREKQDSRDARPGLINAGIYVMTRSVIASIEPDRAVSLEREVLPGLLHGRARGVVFEVPFVDIGVPESYAALGAHPAAVLPIMAVDEARARTTESPPPSAVDRGRSVPSYGGRMGPGPSILG